MGEGETKGQKDPGSKGQHRPGERNDEISSKEVLIPATLRRLGRRNQ